MLKISFCLTFSADLQIRKKLGKSDLGTMCRTTYTAAAAEVSAGMMDSGDLVGTRQQLARTKTCYFGITAI